jgi:tetratricopeptide (TPR) repeat protein
MCGYRHRRRDRGLASDAVLLWPVSEFGCTSSRAVSLLSLAAALLALLLCSPTVLAEPSEQQLLEAREYFAEAEALEQEGQWRAAAELLQRAIAVKDTPGLRYHLAFCQQHTGLLVEALSNYDRARELLDAGADAPDVAALLGPARAEVARRMPTLTLKLRAPVPGARLEVDDRELPAADAERGLPLNPGSYHAVVAAPGHKPVELDVVLDEGDRKIIQAQLQPVQRESAAEQRSATVAPEADRGWSARTVVLATEAAVTLVALSVGVGYAIARSAAAQRADDARTELDRLAPPESNLCRAPGSDVAATCARLEDANDDGIYASRMATYGFVAGGLAAAATLATFTLWAPGDSSEALGLGAGPVAGGLHCTFGGSF